MTATAPCVHTKLTLPQGTRRHPVYASHYRFGAASRPAPLVVYVGGAAMTRDYLARVSTEPTPIRDPLAEAVATEAPRALDAFICPCPMDTEGAGTEWFADHLEHELLPHLANPPTGIVFAGYSAGAAYALRAAILHEARAIALLGSAGVETELRQVDLRNLLDHARAEGAWACEVGIWRNEGDDGTRPARLTELLPLPLRGKPRPAAVGGHAYADYLANGSVAGAFRFLLKALRT